jgi:hypothetical protein
MPLKHETLLQILNEIQKSPEYTRYQNEVERISRFLHGDQWSFRNAGQVSQKLIADPKEETIYPSMPVLNWAARVVINRISSFNFNPIVSFPNMADPMLAAAIMAAVRDIPVTNIVHSLAANLYLFGIAGVCARVSGAKFVIEVKLPSQILLDPEIPDIQRMRFYGYTEKLTPARIVELFNEKVNAGKDGYVDVYHLYLRPDLIGGLEEEEQEYERELVYAVFTKEKILYREEVSLPNFFIEIYSEDVIHTYPIPMGYYMVQANQAIDRLIKYALENAYRTSQNKIGIKKSAIVNPDSVAENKPGGIIVFDIEGPIADAITHIPAAPLASAHTDLTNSILSLTDMFFHVSEHIKAQQLGTDVSGRTLEQLTAASFLETKRIAEKIASLLERSLYVLVQKFVGGPIPLEIKIGDNFNLPSLPHERLAYILQVIQQVINFPPEVAIGALSILDIPYGKEIRDILEQHFKALALSEAEKAQQRQLEQINQLPQPVRTLLARVGSEVAQAFSKVIQEQAKADPQLASQLIQFIPAVVQQSINQFLNSPPPFPPPGPVPPEGPPENIPPENIPPNFGQP